MLGSITPLGERGRNRRWGVTVTAYLIGAAAGGLLIGTLAGVAGTPWADALSVPVRLGILAALLAVGVALDLGLGGLRLPTVRRQVNEDWIARYRGWVVGLGFGVQLGVGVVTVVTTSTVYAALAAAVLSGSWRSGALIGGTFGIVRGASILVVARVRRPEQLARIDATIRRWAAPARRATVGAAAALSVALAVGAAR